MSNKLLVELSIDEVSSLLNTINMPSDLIASFIICLVDGATLAIVESLEELTNDYFTKFPNIKSSKVKSVWRSLTIWK